MFEPVRGVSAQDGEGLMAIRSVARRARDLIFQVKPFECPPALRARHRPAIDNAETILTQSLRTHYFSYPAYFPDPVDVYLSSEDGRGDLDQHLFDRLNNNRERVVPWIVDAVGDLQGKSVLEVGCGTGATTVALAEQGADLLACDEHDGSLRVASDRLDCYGLSSELRCMDAKHVFAANSGRQFDVILFLAVLEHMTLTERLHALREAWAHTKPGGFIVVDETPNRLWYFDSHTAQEPFFMWLPDDLAIVYSAKTRRPRYNKLFRADHSDDSLLFARWGRGVSYHDFTVALEIEPEQLPVVSCKELFFRRKTGQSNGFSHTPWRKYEKFIHELAPQIHDGFFLAYLDLVFQKPA